MCNGSRAWKCWNSVGFPARRRRAEVAAAVTAELAGLEGFDDQFRELVEEAGRDGRHDLARTRAELVRTRRRPGPAARRIRGTPSPNTAPCRCSGRSWRSWRRGGGELAGGGASWRAGTAAPPSCPPRPRELRATFEEKSAGLAADSPEFGDLLRQLAPEFHVYLVRLLDGGHPLPGHGSGCTWRGSSPTRGIARARRRALTRVLTLDLFEPPQRERIRAEAAA